MINTLLFYHVVLSIIFIMSVLEIGSYKKGLVLYVESNFELILDYYKIII